MAIITLKELVFLNRQRSSPLGNFQTSERAIQQQQFQLLVRQKRMGLNIEPLLNPQLALWLEQLESFIPGIFKPRKKIYLGSRWKAQLQIDEANYWLEVPINAGVVKNKVRLYEWRIVSLPPYNCRNGELMLEKTHGKFMLQKQSVRENPVAVGNTSVKDAYC